MKKIEKLFRPAISLMNRLNYPQKFTLISSVFVLPLSLVMYLLISEIQSRNDFAEKEKIGNIYLRPLRQLWADIPLAQIITNDSTKQNTDEFKQIKNRIDKNFNFLETVNKKHGDALLTTEKFNTIKEILQNLQTIQNTGDIKQKNQEYNFLRQEIDKLRKIVGDKSNLILDPDIDSYYLMDATLLKLPEMQYTLSQIQLLTQKTIQTQQNSIESRTQLIKYLAKLEEYNSELKKNMQDAFNNNPAGNARPKLEQILNDYTNSIDLLTATSIPLTSNNSILSSQVFYTAALENLKRSYILWDKAIIELDVLLQNRINGFVQRQVLLSIFVSMILIVVLYLYIAFYLGVKQTVSSLSAASKQMIDGTVTESIKLENRDELAEVVKSFNDIALALVQANKEVNLLNQRLTDENIRMGAELEVTSKLQKMILPPERELDQIPDLEIAGFMVSASEVGGDYYDVIYHDGKVKIGIGDVTGHGLESGVLMIMVQTAVRTLLEHNETDPKKFLDTLNRTIYQNVQRMKSDKNMTLCLLDYHEGKVRISGQHEEMLIIRRGGLIQRVDTIDLGLPIGLEEEISDFIGYADVQLYPDDVVVLYTDGITEAENFEGQLYGLKRLTEVLKENWQNSANEIKQAVVDDLYKYIGQHKLMDDITLVVLKHKKLEAANKFAEKDVDKNLESMVGSAHPTIKPYHQQLGNERAHV
ncbi:protein-serine/threonine phosphatase [Calothrix sp. NIES-4071]|nr:protein-serine/threonine phosphatase [Calothrix sp. NIES-4071]BAZ64081.1 protein-serine/threonine phosphatase [Calothrix sp. NIES-4105]